METKIIKSEYNKLTDTYVFHFRELNNPLETVEGPFNGQILFHIDSITGDLVKATVYSFKSLRRQLITQLTFLYTKSAILLWFNLIASSFSSKSSNLAYNH